ncbi:50S ribosomal protein L25/general stress protein Ctc [Neptuniibacter sp. CAU 1671]|uniref:50S ribosomal protein L25/general stress protein Ctc n=1 Tax=Neptuniibacter sp. CAU 1671 TaxID=3032593 RepID=UPI0023DC905B|nr:50S ribosomal protein L25/general stress protein Ctc [Neptuniibacter sp. CAU 1671]MDF2181321.1 50S ribosomal protein L25/general stress protein Ctc [Neptuniibacter sp. CAU 1671]
MSNFVVNAVAREDEGKGASRRLRRAGLVPGIVYGGDKRKKPSAISLQNNELVKMLEDQTFFSSLLTLKLDDKEEQVIIKDLQRHPSKPVVLHADFQRVTKTNKIKITVPIKFVGFEKSPASKAACKFAAEKNTAEILCLPTDLPEFVEVNLSVCQNDQVLHLSDISLPAGVEIVALRRGEDHDQGIGYVYAPRGARAAK